MLEMRNCPGSGEELLFTRKALVIGHPVLNLGFIRMGMYGMHCKRTFGVEVFVTKHANPTTLLLNTGLCFKTESLQCDCQVKLFNLCKRSLLSVPHA